MVDVAPGDLVTGSGDERGALAAGSLQRVGRFRFTFADQRWEWSDEVARLHGYAPGEVVPTTALLLSHKHLDDREAVAKNLESIRHTGKPFSSRHRIVDRAGAVHVVVVVGDQLYDDDGRVVGTTGFYIDITGSAASEVQTEVDGHLQALTSRAAIEQAKGVVMAVFGVSADRAFDVLRWRSQEANVKLRDLATQLLHEVENTSLLPASAQDRFAHVLLNIRP